MKSDKKIDSKVISRKRRNIILISLLFAVLVILTIIVSFCISKSHLASEHRKNEPEICETEECAKLGAKMKSFMKPEVSPCDDFYEYSCGNYPKTGHPFEIVTHLFENKEKFDELLKNYQPETKSEKIAMVFMKKCMETRSDSALNEDIWNSNDLTELLLEVAKVEPVHTGFIRNNINFTIVNHETVLHLFIEKEIDENSELWVNDTSLGTEKKVKALDNLNKFPFLDLKKYLRGLLPEENREEFKGAWDADIVENDFKMLQKVFNKFGVSKIKDVLKNKWKNRLEGFLVKNSSPEMACSMKTDKLFKGTLFMIFVKNFVSMENIEIANRSFEELRGVFDEVLDQNTWLDKNLKSLLKLKLKAMKSSLGIPDEHKDLSNIDRMYARVEKEQKVEDQSYLTLVRNLLKMNSEETFLRVARGESMTFGAGSWQLAASYRSETHRISMEPIFFSFPFIHQNLPKWNSIASVGWTIAHEMGHAFDSVRYFIDQTDIPYPMTETMKNEFNQRIDCIVQKYNNFKYFDGTYANGNHTKQEDSADFIGFNLVYKLFKKLGKHQKLVGFENQTIDQTFFLRSAHTYCGSESEETLKYAKSDVHSTMRFRVNGVMSNLVGFAEAFGCEKGSPMNPEKKCLIFK